MFSLIFIFGIISPFFSIATNLYTPPNTASLLAVIKFSPTPKESTFAPCCINELIKYSSNEFVTHILQSAYPASSNISLTFFDRYAKSPLSNLTAEGLIPCGFKTSSNTFIAFGKPLSIVLYVSINNVHP